MKILHVSTQDIEGGAARGAYWLHKGLVHSGVQSNMLVACKKTDEYTVLGPNGKLKKNIYRLLPEVDNLPLNFYKKRQKYIFSPSWVPSFIHHRIKKINPDILNLHWICGGFVTPECLKKINKPLVWTIRDMWGFTGGCHYAFDCDRYVQTCGNCPQLNSGKENDISRKLWIRKNKVYKNLPITIVAISNWLADCARKSRLFRHFKIEVIHNSLDEKIFKPIRKNIAREILNIGLSKNIILFVSLDPTGDERKGFQHLSVAIQELIRGGLGKNTELIILGSSQPEKKQDLGMKTFYIGRLHDDVSIALVYSAADVTVVPSIQEAFGKTALESMACGVPVVSFDATGLKDIIEHKMDGYRAQPFNSADLARGISWVLGNKQRYQNLSQRAREKIEENFSLDDCVENYLKIYKKLLY
jgi:glycosyltransferase involved in cell wall biosynthesis